VVFSNFYGHKLVLKKLLQVKIQNVRPNRTQRNSKVKTCSNCLEMQALPPPQKGKEIHFFVPYFQTLKNFSLPLFCLSSFLAGFCLKISNIYNPESVRLPHPVISFSEDYVTLKSYWKFNMGNCLRSLFNDPSTPSSIANNDPATSGIFLAFATCFGCLKSFRCCLLVLVFAFLNDLMIFLPSIFGCYI